MTRRFKAASIAAALVVSTSVGLAAAPAGASTTPGGGWTVSPQPPVVSVSIPYVHVVVAAPVWAFDRVPQGPSIPVSWRPTNPLAAAAGALYDVEWRYGSTLDQLDWERGWYPFLTATSATSAAFNQGTNGNFEVMNADAVEFRVRTVDPVTAERGPWSTPVVSNIPMDDNAKHQTWGQGSYRDTVYGPHWTNHAYAGDFYGAEHTTTAATYVYGALLPFSGPRLVIIGMKCPHCGKIRLEMQAGSDWNTDKVVYLDTYARTTQHRVVLADVAIPDDLVVNWQINTRATPGRPRVSIDAWGVTHIA